MWDSNWRCKNTKPIVFPHPNSTNKHNKRGITIGVAKIQRFGIGVRVKVGCGITIGVAKIQSQLFTHAQTRPISTTINTTIKKTKLKSKKAKAKAKAKEKAKSKKQKEKAKSKKQKAKNQKRGKGKSKSKSKK